MHNYYKDIVSRIDEPPQWFDENAVPRYGSFHPGKVANIYTNEAALVEIACQSCGTRFKVAFVNGMSDDVADAIARRPHRRIAEKIRDRTIHYGDPPNMLCCEFGASENSRKLQVLEYWSRSPSSDWARDRALEINLADA